MKKITLGTPEKLVPSKFSKSFHYVEREIRYNTENIRSQCTARGFLITLPLHEDEQIYGLGLQLKSFNHRGKKLTLRVNSDPVAATGDSHAPVPFFVSTKGYGVYVDTARFAEFYLGSSKPLESIQKSGTADIATTEEALYKTRTEKETHISVFIPAAKGADLYIMEGETITDVVAQYNLLSGGGPEVPEWALSPLYRCYAKSNRDDVLSIAKYFKSSKIPVKTIGLEPGWQTKAYSCSFVWDSARFPEHKTMLSALLNMGFHINLWEHAFTNPDAPFFEKIKAYSGNYATFNGCVPDFATKEAVDIFSEYHEKLVDEGVDGFKLDECDSSDYTGSWSFPNHAEFPSGLDGEQYHALFGTLYMQAILKALKGRPILSEVRNVGALAAPYPFVLYSDLYDHADFVRGCCTAGFSGLLWTPEVRKVASRTKEEFMRRLWTNVFSVQCLINGWNCEKIPWQELDCEKEVKAALIEREKLVPILKRAFDRYKTEGVPPMRALVSDYTNDPETYNIDNEYLLGDCLLVAPIIYGNQKRSVYLPKGDFRDYFTKEPVKSGWFEVETDTIPVYEKLD